MKVGKVLLCNWGHLAILSYSVILALSSDMIYFDVYYKSSTKFIHI